LDEAQNIKNYYTKQSAAIRQLSAQHRIALTGTPMENRLTELWSIYDFTNPGYLGTLGEFRKTVVLPIERERDEALIAELQRWVKPFMLRRVKKDPAIQLALPEKNEMQTYLSLTVEQGALYENIVSDLLGKLESVGAMQRRGLILSALTRLKQVCDHPNLLLKEDEGASLAAWDPERSNKVLRLLEMVEEIASEGERCLIFTQYVQMGAMLKRLLEQRLELPTPYLYGGVPKAARDEMIASFQDQQSPGCAFVLSLKAGGTGLNLTAANHVIHFDRWWNPAVENQATDRAFRIGQIRNVQVHKYVTLGTLEERIDDMITRKQLLNDQVVGQSENWITELSTDELRDLFSLRKQRLKG
jgi:SNF2 family DNA or RNA helicase